MRIVITSILIVFFVFLTKNNFAQQSTNALQELDTVRITDYASDFIRSNNTYIISSLQKLYTTPTDIADVLQLNTPVYINSYGYGNASSVSIRGGNDDHTNVYWNGLKINALTLGGTDISLIPIESVEEINVQTNTASLGGDIVIRSHPSWDNTFDIKIRSDIGSFNHYRNALSFKIGRKNIQFHSNTFNLQAKNDFTFIDAYKFEFPLDTIEHNRVQQVGTVNSLFLKLKKQQFLTVGSWYGYRDKDIPAIMGTTLPSNKFQHDQNLRHFINWDKYTNHQDYHVSLSHSYDLLNYTDKISPTDSFLLINSNYTTHRVAHSCSASARFKYGLVLLTGYHYNLLFAEVQEYAKKVIDHVGDAFAQLKWQQGNLHASSSITQPFSSFKYIRPQVYAEVCYTLTNKKYGISFSYNDKYRFPDLNDRYWYPGGNPKLSPETGWSVDLANNFDLINSNKGHQLKGQFSVYYSKIKDNIVWTPITNNNWSPKNLKETRLYGTAFQCSYIYTTTAWLLQVNTVYNFNKAQLIKEDNNTDLKGKFLRYKPQHTFRTTFYIEQQYFGVGLNYQIVSKRYTDEENFEFFALKKYSLLDMYLTFKCNVKRHQFQALFKINNITNVSYESIRSYAQPLRNYMLTFIYHFKK